MNTLRGYHFQPIAKTKDVLFMILQAQMLFVKALFPKCLSYWPSVVSFNGGLGKSRAKQEYSACMSACVKSDPSNNPPAPDIQRESANKNKISYPDKSTNHIIYSSFLRESLRGLKLWKPMIWMSKSNHMSYFVVIYILTYWLNDFGFKILR